MLSVTKDIKQLYGCIFLQEKKSVMEHNNWSDYLAMRRGKKKKIYLSALLLMLIANSYS